MSKRVRFSALAAVITIFVPLATACSTTIEDNAEEAFTSTTAPPATSTTIPGGSVDELFAQILAIGTDVGNDVATGKMREARAKLAEIKATWIGLEGKLTSFNSEVQDDLARLVALFTTSVERKRPADADKAMRYLPLALEALGISV